MEFRKNGLEMGYGKGDTKEEEQVKKEQEKEIKDGKKREEGRVEIREGGI
jgi:hypothetical protein